MNRIYLSQKDKKCAGVLGGIGETYDVDPTLLRLITILIALITGIVPVLIAYLIAWAIIPKKSKSAH